MLALKATLALATLLLGQSSHAQNTTRACNNSPLLCDRAYNNVTYLGAHDSPFVRNSSNGYSLSGNQFFTSPVQLDAGVRLLTGQVHTTGSGATLGIYLCHTICQLYNAGTLSGWLASIKSWLDNNPNEVVTILLVNSNNLGADTYQPIFDSADITKYIYAPADPTVTATTWPTLNEMIDMNKRLVVYFQPLVNTSSLFLDQYVFTFENQYDVLNETDFSCVANRPANVANNTALALSMGLMPVMNHFLDKLIGDNIQIPAVLNASLTNAPSGAVGNLGDSAKACTQAYGKAPNYVVVDFFNVGPAIDTVDELNGVTGNIVGRRSLPNQIYTSGPGPTQTVPIGGSTSSTSAVTTTSSSSGTLTGSSTGVPSTTSTHSGTVPPYNNSTTSGLPTGTAGVSQTSKVGSTSVSIISGNQTPTSLPGANAALGRRGQVGSATVLGCVVGFVMALGVPLVVMRGGH